MTQILKSWELYKVASEKCNVKTWSAIIGFEDGGGDYETRNVAASRTWEQPSADSLQGSRLPHNHKKQNAANNWHHQGKHSPLELWKEMQPWGNLHFHLVRPTADFWPTEL